MAKRYGEWIQQNNEITQVDENGKNKLYRDKDALQSYLKHINDNTRQFDNEVERVRILTKENVYDSVFENIPDTIIKAVSYTHLRAHET